MKWIAVSINAALLFSASIVNAAQPCEPFWGEEFGSGDVSGGTNDMCGFDDGSGMQLYVAGNPDAVWGARMHIVRWNGLSWEDVPTVYSSSGQIEVLAVYDDGSGETLYAAGDGLIQFPGLNWRSTVIRREGNEWAPVGVLELDGIYDLCVFDDGGGPALFAAGNDSTSGEVWKWDGTSWSRVGGVFSRLVRTLSVCDLGSGPKLYAGGSFKFVDGVEVWSIAMWDGSSWTQLGEGIRNNLNPGTVYTIEAHDDGAGIAIYAGGRFISAGSVTAQNLAKWDGITWSNVGDAIGRVYTITSHESGVGSSLIVGGSFSTIGGVSASGIAQRIGTDWSDLGGGFAASSRADASTIHDFGSGPEFVLAGGQFQVASTGMAIGGVARWDGTTWNRLRQGDGLSGSVESLVESSLSGDSAVYAAGRFLGAGSSYVGNVARRDETGWHPLAGGVNGPIGGMTAYHDGSEDSIVVAGSFSAAFNSPDPYMGTPDELPANRVARWNGTKWSAMGDGIGYDRPSVTAVQSFDDGSGPSVYVSYTEFVGTSWKNEVEWWDGDHWNLIPKGLQYPIQRFAVHDDGSGASLYGAGSDLMINHSVVRLESGQWVGVGGAIQGYVRDVFVHDDGVLGPMLFAIGSFKLLGVSGYVKFARWDGVAWEELPGTSGSSAAVHTVGGREILYIHSGGSLHEVQPGLAWKPVTSGADYTVNDMLIIDGPLRPKLYIGGDFEHVAGIPSRRFARLDLCSLCYADCDQSTGSGKLDIFDFLCFQNSFVNSEPYACDCDSSTGAGVCDIFDFLCFQNEFVNGCP